MLSRSAENKGAKNDQFAMIFVHFLEFTIMIFVILLGIGNNQETENQYNIIFVILTKQQRIKPKK